MAFDTSTLIARLTTPGLNPRRTVQPIGAAPTSRPQVTSSVGNGAADFDYTITGTPQKQRTDFKKVITDILAGQKSTSQKNLDDASAALKTNRDDYSNRIGDLLAAQDAALSGNRASYRSAMQALIDKDQADSDAGYHDAELAEKLGMDQAVASGDRSAKAMFAMKGGGPSSYADRLAIGIRAKANSDMAQRLAALKRSDRLRLADRRASLEAGLSDRERSDLGMSYGGKLNLNNRLSDLDRSDLGFKFSNQNAINDRDYAAQLGLEQQMYNDELARPSYTPPPPKRQSPLTPYF